MALFQAQLEADHHGPNSRLTMAPALIDNQLGLHINEKKLIHGVDAWEENHEVRARGNYHAANAPS